MPDDDDEDNVMCFPFVLRYRFQLRVPFSAVSPPSYVKVLVTLSSLGIYK